ncbi:hypothetical protein STSP2_01173 [Anaerohalosphaera lusitana]|uniref:Uncharacterized protein n=1 Tax=Anaerohalosphaera lusitana TaxID=1936003 RepID=A0A1U9NJB5_9BACT|nr:hypothetical protein STSP2_01173 [Anaerohalosphaera lusitana]
MPESQRLAKTFAYGGLAPWMVLAVSYCAGLRWRFLKELLDAFYVLGVLSYVLFYLVGVDAGWNLLNELIIFSLILSAILWFMRRHVFADKG